MPSRSHADTPATYVAQWAPTSEFPSCPPTTVGTGMLVSLSEGVRVPKSVASCRSSASGNRVKTSSRCKSRGAGVLRPADTPATSDASGFSGLQRANFPAAARQWYSTGMLVPSSKGPIVDKSVASCWSSASGHRTKLLDIQSTFFNFQKLDVECVFNKPHGSFTTDIPECIHRWPLNNLRRKRRRKRGSRGGLMIKLKACLHAGCISSPFLKPLYGGSVIWRLLDQAHWWLRPVLPLFPPSGPRVGLPRIGRYLRRTGAAPGVLRPLCRVPLSPGAVPPPIWF